MPIKLFQGLGTIFEKCVNFNTIEKVGRFGKKIAPALKTVCQKTAPSRKKSQPRTKRGQLKLGCFGNLANAIVTPIRQPEFPEAFVDSHR
jgi:hypothetical protein